MKKKYFLFFVQMLIITLTPTLFGVNYPLVEYKVKAENNAKKEIVKKIIAAYKTNNTANLNNINAGENLGKIIITKKTTQHQGWASKTEHFITITNTTPLAAAIEIKQISNKGYSVIEKFITKDTNLFSEYTTRNDEYNDEYTVTPISAIIRNKLLEWFYDKIIENLIHTKNVNKPVNSNGDTLLHILSSNDAFLDQVKILINNNADLEITNNDGEFPLFIASKGGRLQDKNKTPNNSQDIFTYLAEVYQNDTKYNLGKVFTIDNVKHSPFELLWQSKNNNIQWHALFNVVNRNEENAPLNAFGNRLLHYLAETDTKIYDDTYTVQNVINDIKTAHFKNSSQPVTLDFNIKNESGQTPLDVALKNYNQEMVQLLMSKGAQLNNLDKKINDLVKKIITHDKIQWKNYMNITSKEIELLELFLKHGAKKDGLADIIKNSHAYKNWGDNAKNNLDHVIEIINTTNPNPGISSSSTGSSSSSSSGAGSSSSHTPSSPPQKKSKKTTPPVTVKKAKDPLTKQLSTLTKKLTTLKEKLKDLAANLGLLKTKLGVTK